MADLLIRDQPLPGVFVLNNSQFVDHRGDFTKLFHSKALLAQGLLFTPAESFLTRSKESVLRGMHFQVGKAAHDKIVTCIKGHVLDVVVNINPNSPFFNQPFSVELSENKNISLLIGKDYAHGFLTLADDSWMLYATTTVHSPSCDRGVLWSSISFNWPETNPIVSYRDKQHPSILELA